MSDRRIPSFLSFWASFSCHSERQRRIPSGDPSANASGWQRGCHSERQRRISYLFFFFLFKACN